MEQPLDFIPTEDLVSEIKRRYDSMFFIGYKRTTNKRSDYHCATNADPHEVIGLLEMAKDIARDIGASDED